MKRILLFFLFLTLGLHAYCISNNTNQNLFFMVESYGSKADSILTFKQFIKPEETLCCSVDNISCNPSLKKNSKLSFYVFINKSSLEGCDIFGTSSSNIKLKLYQSFDNCIWE